MCLFGQNFKVVCFVLDCFRLTPFDEDDDAEVKLTKSKDMKVVLSNCNPVSLAVTMAPLLYIVLLSFNMLLAVQHDERS